MWSDSVTWRNIKICVYFMYSKQDDFLSYKWLTFCFNFSSARSCIGTCITTSGEELQRVFCSQSQGPGVLMGMRYSQYLQYEILNLYYFVKILYFCTFIILLQSFYSFPAIISQHEKLSRNSLYLGPFNSSNWKDVVNYNYSRGSNFWCHCKYRFLPLPLKSWLLRVVLSAVFA